jgi:hypothetical protein
MMAHAAHAGRDSAPSASRHSDARRRGEADAAPPVQVLPRAHAYARISMGGRVSKL